MISHENRVIAGAMLLTAAILATLFAAESWLGFRLSEAPLVGFLLFTGVSIWLPQLYLARTDTTVDPHLRLQVAVLLTMLFAGVSIQERGNPQHKVVLLIAGSSFLALLGYELYSGYRETLCDGFSEDF